MKNRLLVFLLVLSLAACSNPAVSLQTSKASTTQVDPPDTASPVAPQPTRAVSLADDSPLSPAPTVSATAAQTVSSPDRRSDSIAGMYIGRGDNPAQVSLFEQSGAAWVRLDNFHWNKIEPQRTQPATYDWSSVNEKALTNLSKMGANLIGVVQFTPGWAQKYPGFSCGPVAQESLQAFGEFMNAVVQRYSQPPYNVKYWELGNEPDVAHGDVPGNSVFGCWGERGDPYFGGGYYGEMLQEVYPQVKAANPQAQVLVGGLLMDCDPVNPPETQPGSGVAKDCSSSKFLEGILAQGAGEEFDAISFHAYDYYMGAGNYANPNWHSGWDTTGPVLSAKVNYLRSLLTQYGQPDKPLLNTEVALLCGRSGKEPSCQTDEFNHAQAAYIAESMAAAKEQGLLANLWYSLIGWRGSRLVDDDLKTLPTMDAYTFSAHKLGKAEFSRRIGEYPDVKISSYTDGDAQIWVLQSTSSSEQEVSLPSLPSNAYDTFGRPLSVGKVMRVGRQPVYVEWTR